MITSKLLKIKRKRIFFCKTCRKLTNTMTSGQKIAFSMLVTLFLFAGFVIGANCKIFNEIETRFYAQSKITEKTSQLDNIAESFDTYIANILSLTDDYANQSVVSSYLEQNPSEFAVSGRRNLTENLFSQLKCLNGIRIVDKNGRNVHYSSYDSTDILKQNGITKTYKNYPDIQKDSGEIDYHFISSGESEKKSKILVDSDKNRLIIVKPMYLMENIYNADFVFYFDFYTVRQDLIASNVFAYGENFSIYSNDEMKGGIVIGLPKNSYSYFKYPVLENWKKKTKLNINTQPEKIVTEADNQYWTLLTADKGDFINVSGVFLSKYFELTKDIIWMIYVCVFLTVFLIVYLIFSLRQDSYFSVKRKIKLLQQGIIQEYVSNKTEVDWKQVLSQLKSNKDDLLVKFKKDLSKKSRKNSNKIEQLLDEGWNNIISVIENPQEKAPQEIVQSASSSPVPGFSMVELRAMIEDVLKTAKLNVNAVQTIQKVEPVVSQAEEVIDEVEELDDAEEVIDEVEELDDAEEVVDEVEELDDAEEVVDEVEELDDAEEVVDEVEELDDAEESVDEVEELDDAEEAVDEVEELDDAEEVVDEVEELDDAEEVVDEVEELDDAEEAVDEVEELDDAEEAVDEVEELDDAEESVDEVEELDDAEESVDEVEELDDAEESVDEVEELDDADESVDEVEYEEKPVSVPSSDDIFGDFVPKARGYEKDNESFIRSEKFATVDDLFAEEISLGGEYTPENKESETVLNFKIFKYESPVRENIETPDVDDLTEEIENFNEEQKQLLEDIETLTEEVPEAEAKKYFSMTGFAQETEEVDTLELIDVIEEKEDGVFQITENVDCTNPNLDMDFKKLVDSVLKNHKE